MLQVPELTLCNHDAAPCCHNLPCRPPCVHNCEGEEKDCARRLEMWYALNLSQIVARDVANLKLHSQTVSFAAVHSDLALSGTPGRRSCTALRFLSPATLPADTRHPVLCPAYAE